MKKNKELIILFVILSILIISAGCILIYKITQNKDNQTKTAT